MKNEKKLQFAIVMKFSQRWPEKDGQLFAVRNTTFSAKDGMTQRALGMKAGVSDLIYYNKIMYCIEVKNKNSEHSKDHIKQQLKFGESIEKVGGKYYIVTSVEAFESIIEGSISEEVFTIDKIKEKIKNSKSKVKF